MIGLTKRWSESLPGVTFSFQMIKTFLVIATLGVGSDRSAFSR